MKTFEQWMEEWKPFPKDKVNRQIERKEKRGPENELDRLNAHKMRRVRAANADVEKAKQKQSGKDGKKFDNEGNRLYDKADSDWAKEEKQRGKAEKARAKGKDEKAAKLEKKADKNLRKGKQAYMKADGMKAERQAYGRKSKEDDAKQDEHNKRDKEARKKAQGMLDRANLSIARAKPAVKGATKGGFKKESMNFTDYCDSIVAPLYEKEGELPRCPPGYKWDKETVMCVPKTEKDAVGDRQKGKDKELKPGNGAGYNVFGNSGYNGGFAFEEPPTPNDTANGGGGI